MKTVTHNGGGCAKAEINSDKLDRVKIKYSNGIETIKSDNSRMIRQHCAEKKHVTKVNHSQNVTGAVVDDVGENLKKIDSVQVRF